MMTRSFQGSGPHVGIRWVLRVLTGSMDLGFSCLGSRGSGVRGLGFWAYWVAVE